MRDCASALDRVLCHSRSCGQLHAISVRGLAGPEAVERFADVMRARGAWGYKARLERAKRERGARAIDMIARHIPESMRDGFSVSQLAAIRRAADRIAQHFYGMGQRSVHRRNTNDNRRKREAA